MLDVISANRWRLDLLDILVRHSEPSSHRQGCICGLTVSRFTDRTGDVPVTFDCLVKLIMMASLKIYTTWCESKC
jgi:hypothetical protein